MSLSHVTTSVALVIYNDAGDIFTIQELQEKEHFLKIPGLSDYSFPWETQEEGESDKQTLERVYFEEVDAKGVLLTSEPVQFCSQLPILDGRVLVTAYSCRYQGGSTNVRGSAAGTEILHLGFQPPEFILSRCRGGIPEIMTAFRRSL